MSDTTATHPGQSAADPSPAVLGFIAAPFTPMNTDGSLNLAMISNYASHLKKSGVAGVFMNGTTGEGYSLSISERMKTAETWIREQTTQFRVMIHVGAESPIEAADLARHASDIGASAIGAMSPVFFKPDLESMLRWSGDLAVAAGELPFYYYHMPSMTGASFSVLDLLRRAASLIPNFRGVKYTHNDLVEYRLCASINGGQFDMLFGRDEALLPALSLGARGMVGSTYNYAMEIHHATIEAFSAGRMTEAATSQEQVMKLAEILGAHGGGVVCGKPLMKAVGLDLGPCRSPLPTLDSQETAAAIDAARQTGAFGRAAM